METSRPSFQSLLIEMQFDGATLSTGTAFVVETPNRGPHLITNRHTVTGRHQDTGEPLSTTAGIPNHLVVIHNRLDKNGGWIRCTEPLYEGETPRWIEHPRLGPRADFVALPLTELTNVALYPYDPSNPGDDIRVGPADAVSIIGFPFGLVAGDGYAIWATGFVASEPEVNYEDLPIILVDCRGREGQSGSPVLAYRASGTATMSDGAFAVNGTPLQRFIGIYSGRVNRESDLGRVWKASAIAELIQTL